NGDGTYTDVTGASGTGEPRWSAAAAFFDAEGDGDLDLFVVNYVDFNLATVKPCSNTDGRPDYCGPLSYEPEPDRLFLNDGDGTFTDASGRAGIHAAYGRGLGVVTADFDDDGRTDVYVANDGMANFLWMNEGAGRFRERAVLAGTAVNARGVAEASMGVDADDVDNDGDDDLFMTHLIEESNTLYRNEGGGLFMDATAATRLGAPSLPYTGFGTAFLDADTDGWLDVVVANGAVKKIARLERAGDPYPLHEPNHFYRNRGDGTFEDATAEAGAVFARSEVSRAMAVGDVDNDGDPDVLLSNNSGPARLLVNQRGQDRHWVGLRLLDAAGRDAVGARVTVTLADGTVRHRRARTDGSYASARDPRVLVGLGAAAGPVRVVVRWPGGRREAWEAVAPDRYTTLTEGTGQPVPAS
ncbi:MAG: CRTAC1 family protein, partial [Rhodothermales bacterium]|nr:CRTAC1 family protein [Rhodothermales bacterium]